jgi:hypothetical protein
MHHLPACSGKKDVIGVENLKGSGMIAGEASQAYDEVFTINLVRITPTISLGIGHSPCVSASQHYQCFTCKAPSKD